MPDLIWPARIFGAALIAIGLVLVIFDSLDLSRMPSDLFPTPERENRESRDFALAWWGLFMVGLGVAAFGLTGAFAS